MSTWNPAKAAAGIILSNGNLTVAGDGSGNHFAVLGTLAKTIGDWYVFSAVADVVGGSSSMGVGVGPSTIDIEANLWTTAAYTYWDTGVLWNNNGQTAGTGYVQGDTIYTFYNPTLGEIRWYVNSDPTPRHTVTGVPAGWFPAASVALTSQFTANFATAAAPVGPAAVSWDAAAGSLYDKYLSVDQSTNQIVSPSKGIDPQFLQPLINDTLVAGNNNDDARVYSIAGLDTYIAGLGLATQLDDLTDVTGTPGTAGQVLTAVGDGTYAIQDVTTPPRGDFQTLSLINGATVEDAGAPPRYYLDQNGVVNMLGRVSVDSSTGTGLVIANLPAAFRPASNKYFSNAMVNSGNSVVVGRTEVRTNGDVVVVGQTSGLIVGWVALDEIRFLAAGS